MANLTTMTEKEKKNHLAKIMGRINSSKFIIEDVTPKGYGPENK